MLDLNVVGQNIVCARPSAGYPMANKPVMPKGTARLENLRMIFRMPRPRFKAGNDYTNLTHIWLYYYNVSKKSADREKGAPCGSSLAAG
jgi:hypothetical protein